MQKLQERYFFLIFFSFFVILLSIALIMPIIDPKFSSFFDSIYWAIITVTTVGYGDFVPTTEIARIVTIVLALLGSAFMAYFSAYITAKLIEILIKNLKDWQKMENVNNHLIVCGYNLQTELIIEHFISKKIFAHDQIVLIHESLSSNVENLLENTRSSLWKEISVMKRR